MTKLVDEFGNPLVQAMERPEDRGWKLDANAYDLINQWCDTDHWMYSSNQTHNNANDPYTLSMIRRAARMEYNNSSDCKGIVLKLVHEVIGTGPRLQIEPRRSTKESNRAAKSFESFWTEYAEESCFAENLRTALTETIVGGENFCVFRQNPKLMTLDIDWQNYEADQFASPYRAYTMAWRQGQERVDGLQLDAYGNVAAYHKLKYHPGGDHYGAGAPYNYDTLSPDYVAQLFRRERPTQYRGVSWLAPSLPLFAKLRRYTEAVLTTAENHASVLGTMETGFAPDDCEMPASGAYRLPFGNGQLNILPRGWKHNPWRAEQPVDTFEMFRRAILHEAISSILIPFNVAASDSSDFNFASGQLDHRIWDRVIEVIRTWIERILLNRFFDYWFRFAELTPAPGIVPTQLGAFAHGWYWDLKTPIDPAKKATADTTLKEGGLLDEFAYWQSQNLTYREAIDQKLAMELYEKERREELGLEQPMENENGNNSTETAEETSQESVASS